jgi:hypothetical protein
MIIIGTHLKRKANCGGAPRIPLFPTPPSTREQVPTQYLPIQYSRTPLQLQSSSPNVTILEQVTELLRISSSILMRDRKLSEFHNSPGSGPSVAHHWLTVTTGSFVWILKKSLEMWNGRCYCLITAVHATEYRTCAVGIAKHTLTCL